MPNLPPVAWLAIAAAVLVLVALCVGVLVLTLRAPMRRRISRWPPGVPVVLVALASVPWLVAKFAPITIRINIHGTVGLAGWVLVALLVFGLLVLFPLAVVASTLVWWTAHRRGAATAGRDAATTEH